MESVQNGEPPATSMGSITWLPAAITAGMSFRHSLSSLNTLNTLSAANSPGGSGPRPLSAPQMGPQTRSQTGPAHLAADSVHAGVAGDADAARARDVAASASALYCQGQFRAALQRYAEAVRLRPVEAEYHYGLACAAWKAEESRLVEPHFLEAIRLQPGHAPALDGLGQWCLENGELSRAQEYSAAALAADPRDTDYIISRGFVLSAAGEEQAAWELIEPLATAPAAARGEAGLRLAVLYAQIAPKLKGDSRDGTPPPARAVAFVQRVLASPDLSPAGRPQLHFAAAALLDRMGRHDDAFEQARLANEAGRRPHNPAAHSEWVSRLIRYFSRRRLKALPRALPTGAQAKRRPVLIVGMPRSGTSLVEQILDSHPAVIGRGELADLGRITGLMNGADWSEGDAFPECLDSLSVRRANRLAEEYLSAVEATTDPDKADVQYVTDKMPSNCFGLGLAEVLLPGCQVIHCIRNPLDTCLSCYMTGFAFGHGFTADLEHLGAYYRDYRRVMEHWRKVLSLSILDVRYEDLVLDTEGQVRRMLEFLGLPWDERSLRFYENPRRVRTASKEQIKRPIYASSIGRWKHYEKHLAGLIAALGGPAAGPRRSPQV